MDQDTLFNVGLVLVFVLIGGVFAGTEFALVSLRESQLARLEKQGPRGARVAAVARDPNRFLAAVQIGVTVAGFLSAAYGASTLAPDFVPALRSVGLPQAVAQNGSLILLTLVIAYFSLILGELVPKRFALQRSAGIALLVAPPLDRFATAMRPIIWLLSVSTNAVVRLLGGDPTARSEVMTEQELRDLIIAHESLPADERKILHDVLDAGDRTLGEVMRPRGDVAFVPASMTLDQARAMISALPYSRYPVTGHDFDDVIGFVHVRDLLDTSMTGTLADITREILLLPSTNHLLPTLSTMRRQGIHIAIVVDEYGGTDGIVTLEDLVEELVGDIRDEHDTPTELVSRDTPGTLRLDAGMTIEELAEHLHVDLEDGPYETVAGYVVGRLGRLGRVGDTVRTKDVTLTVSQVKERRIIAIDAALHSGADGSSTGDQFPDSRT